jgi:hypothetical protein
MKERPILFSPTMVEAIITGRKTVTRRIINPQPLNIISQGIGPASLRYTAEAVLDSYRTPPALIECPFGRRGDYLWVRETWAAHLLHDGKKPSDIKPGVKIWYKADNRVHQQDQGKWRPSIFMPRWASRLTLQIININAVKLQTIRRPDIEAEGVSLEAFKLHKQLDDTINMDLAAQYKFEQLWNALNAKRGYSWEDDPWVWRIEFALVETKETP